MRRALWCLEVIALLTAITACALSSRSAASGQVQCDDVTSVNFQSMNVEIPGRGMVQLDHGTGFSSDGGPAGESRNWKITLVQDKILRPTTLVSLRLIRFNADHVTGSGTWDHVFIYQCRNGKLVRLFEERYLYGVKIQRVSDDELIFISGEWLKDDPMCCPSNEKRSVYWWDPSGKKFVLVENSIRARTKDSK